MLGKDLEVFFDFKRYGSNARQLQWYKTEHEALPTLVITLTDTGQHLWTTAESGLNASCKPKITSVTKFKGVLTCNDLTYSTSESWRNNDNKIVVQRFKYQIWKISSISASSKVWTVLKSDVDRAARAHNADLKQSEDPDLPGDNDEEGDNGDDSTSHKTPSNAKGKSSKTQSKHSNKPSSEDSLPEQSTKTQQRKPHASVGYHRQNEAASPEPIESSGVRAPAVVNYKAAPSSTEAMSGPSRRAASFPRQESGGGEREDDDDDDDTERPKESESEKTRSSESKPARASSADDSDVSEPSQLIWFLDLEVHNRWPSRAICQITAVRADHGLAFDAYIRRAPLHRSYEDVITYAEIYLRDAARTAREEHRKKHVYGSAGTGHANAEADKEDDKERESAIDRMNAEATTNRYKRLCLHAWDNPVVTISLEQALCEWIALMKPQSVIVCMGASDFAVIMMNLYEHCGLTQAEAILNKLYEKEIYVANHIGVLKYVANCVERNRTELGVKGSLAKMHSSLFVDTIVADESGHASTIAEDAWHYMHHSSSNSTSGSSSSSSSSTSPLAGISRALDSEGYICETDIVNARHKETRIRIHLDRDRVPRWHTAHTDVLVFKNVVASLVFYAHISATRRLAKKDKARDYMNKLMRVITIKTVGFVRHNLKIPDSAARGLYLFLTTKKFVQPGSYEPAVKRNWDASRQARIQLFHEVRRQKKTNAYALDFDMDIEHQSLLTGRTGLSSDSYSIELDEILASTPQHMKEHAIRKRNTRFGSITAVVQHEAVEGTRTRREETRIHKSAFRLLDSNTLFSYSYAGEGFDEKLKTSLENKAVLSAITETLLITDKLTDDSSESDQYDGSSSSSSLSGSRGPRTSRSRTASHKSHISDVKNWPLYYSKASIGSGVVTLHNKYCHTLYWVDKSRAHSTPEGLLRRVQKSDIIFYVPSDDIFTQSTPVFCKQCKRYTFSLDVSMPLMLLESYKTDPYTDKPVSIAFAERMRSVYLSSGPLHNRASTRALSFDLNAPEPGELLADSEDAFRDANEDAHFASRVYRQRGLAYDEDETDRDEDIDDSETDRSRGARNSSDSSNSSHTSRASNAASSSSSSSSSSSPRSPWTNTAPSTDSSSSASLSYTLSQVPWRQRNARNRRPPSPMPLHNN